MMKKQQILLAILALSFFSLNMACAQVLFGVKAGVNLAYISYSNDYIEASEAGISGSIKTGSIPTFHIGGQAEFGFGGGFGLSMGLQLNVKGGSLDLAGILLGEPFTAKSKARPMYLQVPVALIYNKNSFYAGAGPYVGFGVGGKLKTEVEAAGQSDEVSEDIEFGDDSDDAFAPLDYGVGLEIGYEINRRVRLSLSYQLGLANVAPKDAVDEGDAAGLDFSYKHSVVGFSVAYLFEK